MKTVNSYTALIKDKKVTFKHIGTAITPAFKSVTSVSVIPFTKNGDIVAVRLRHRGIDIPGGHVEPGETTPEQTMNREVMEEAHMTIHNPILIEVIESDYFDHPSYMLLYGAFVDELYEFKPSEDELSYERVVLSQEEFIKRYEAGDRRLMHLAVEMAWKQLKSQTQILEKI
jgi:8-oxo-dGTP diphosphatase